MSFPQLLFGLLSLCDIADVALNDLLSALSINVADEFDEPFAELSLKRQIVITKEALIFQFSKRLPGGFQIFKQANFPKLLSENVFTRIAQHLGHERIRFRNSLLSRFE